MGTRRTVAYPLQRPLFASIRWEWWRSPSFPIPQGVSTASLSCRSM
jgi:hypothetical protein